MIIVPRKQGQLANRLFHLSKIYAFCLKYNIPLIYPPFYEYKKLFMLKTSKNKATLLTGNFLVYKVIQIIYRILIKIKFYSSHFHQIIKLGDFTSKYKIDSPDFIKTTESKLFVFLDGWGIDSGNLHISYKQKITELLEPITYHLISAENIINTLRSKTNIIIGIHIRRGDYKTFENGRFYYEFQDYYRIILECVKQFDEKSIYFIITSNENCEKKFPIDKELNLHFSHENEYIDSIILSLCDYIIGPPSTFTLWASYFSNVPLQMIKNKSQKITMSGFQTYEESHQ